MASRESAAEVGTLFSPPKEGQIIWHESKEYRTIKEGLAYILVDSNPEASTSEKKQNQNQKSTEADRPSVFYNPIQQFNRDLSVLAIRAYGEHAIASKEIKHASRVKHRARNGSDKKRKREAAEEVKDEDAGNGLPVKKTCSSKDADKTESGEAMVEPNENATESLDNPSNGQPTPIKHTFSILDALSASGLRALRYAKEIPFTTRVVANDLSALAIQSMKLNIEHNGVENLVRTNRGDACGYMYSVSGPSISNKDGNNFGKFDVVDLDPYGTAAPFLDAAIQSVSDGGMLCVTCTDAAVFAGVGYPEKTFALYGGIPIKGPHSHEGGLRLILHAVATTAARYGLAIEPLLSLSIDFYARVFIRVHKSPLGAKCTAIKTMVTYNCDQGCGAWTTQPLAGRKLHAGKNGIPFYSYTLSQAPTAAPNCEHCGYKTHLAGPMWAGPLHNPHFIQRILDLVPGADKDTYQTCGRIEGMLTTALEEDLNIGGTSELSTPEAQPENSSEKAKDQTQDQTNRSLLIPRVDPALVELHPFFFVISSLSRVLRTSTMPEDVFRGALRNLGYRSTRSHARASSIRTDAPWAVIWEIMREWVRQKAPIKEGALSETTAGAGILRRSRQQLNPGDGEGVGLRALKRDILTAVESGKNLSDLRTKIEAALYRSGVNRPEEQVEKPVAENTANASKPIGSQLDPSTLDIVFDETLGKQAVASQRQKRLIRYQTNPRPNWGPLTRAPVVSKP
ncbi:RNA methyltransferase tRNA(m5U54)methyltransferase [Myotisia sp. PD_48]|nr:RNA methyltransferase tRNA(m5U54)methyltransferase [Myotisia sp. PD_48]